MNVYKVTGKNNSGSEAPDTETRWAGSQTEAAKARKALGEAGFKRSEIETHTVEIPTNKDGLLEWLNKNVR